jgi:cbb3-type cytochrome oxidase maturation protein
MSVILVLILASLGLATTFLLAFVWAVRSGQFDDTQTPAVRLLLDSVPPASPNSTVPNLQQAAEHERRDIQVR